MSSGTAEIWAARTPPPIFAEALIEMEADRLAPTLTLVSSLFPTVSKKNPSRKRGVQPISVPFAQESRPEQSTIVKS